MEIQLPSNREAQPLWKPAGEINWPSLHHSISSWSQTPGWDAIEREITKRFGGFTGLRTLELGCGLAKISLLMALKGSSTTLLDYNRQALDQAKHVRAATGLTAEFIEADLLQLPETIARRFDVTMSFGTAEHFLGKERQAVFDAHCIPLRPGGLAILWVPNRWGIFYRIAHGLQVAAGLWPEELPELAFTRTELMVRARQAGLHAIQVVGGETLTEDFRNFIWNNFKAVVRKVSGRRSVGSAGDENVPPSADKWRQMAHLASRKGRAGLLAQHLCYPLVLMGVK